MGLQGRVESGSASQPPLESPSGVQSVHLRISSKLCIPDKPEKWKMVPLDRHFIYVFSFHLFLARNCMRPDDSRGKTYSSVLDSLAIAAGWPVEPALPSVGFEEPSLAWSLASYLVSGRPSSGKFKMPTLYLLWAPSQHSKGLTIGTAPPGRCPVLLPSLPFTWEATLLLPGYLPVSDLLSLGAEVLTPHLSIHSPSSFWSAQRQKIKPNQKWDRRADRHRGRDYVRSSSTAKFPLKRSVIFKNKTTD